MRRGRRRRRRVVLGFAGAMLVAGGGAVTYRAASLPHRLERLRAEIAIHQRLGRDAEAAAASERLLALDPSDLDALERVATHLAATGRLAEAERLLRAAPPGPRSVCLLAELLHADGRDAEAAAVLEPLLRDLAALPQVDLRVRLALLGGRVLAETGDLPRAQALLETCAELRDGFGLRNDTGDAMVVDLLALAEVQGRLGRWADAEDALRRAHRLASDGPIVCRLLAETLERRGAVDEAVAVLAEHWRTSPAKRPEQAAAYLALLVRAGRLAEASAAADEVAPEAPWAPPFARALAAALVDPAVVEAEVEDALRHDGPALEARLVAARAALLRDDLPAARRWLAGALEAAPGRADLEVELLRVEQRLGELAPVRARAVRLLSDADARDAALEGLLLLAADEPAALNDAGRRVEELLSTSPADPWLRATRAVLLTVSGEVEAGARALADLAAVPEVDLVDALALVARGAEACGDPFRAVDLMSELSRRDPRLAPARLVGARLLVALDRAELAREELDGVLAADPELVAGWALLADLLEASGDLVGAAGALERANELSPGDVGLSRTLASLRQRSGDPAGAAALLAKLADAYPDDADLRAALARARALAGQRGFAAIEYQAALRLDPACVSAYGLAALHALEGADADARRVLERAPTGQVRSLRAALAAACALTGDHAAALDVLRGAAPAVDDLTARAVTEAVLLVRTGDVEAAAALLAGASAVPGPVKAAALGASAEVARAFHRSLLLQALGYQAELSERARALVADERGDLLLVWWTLRGLDRDADPALRVGLAERLLAGAPGDLAAGLSRAEVLDAAGEAVRARQALEALVEQHDVAPVWERLAQARHAGGDRAGSIVAYERALELDPERLVSLNNLAFALGSDPEARPRAVELAGRALELAPDVAAVSDTLGWLLWLEGDADAALQHLRRAVALDPLDPVARYHLARVRHAAGDVEQARALVELALLSGASFSERAEAEALRAELGGAR